MFTIELLPNSNKLRQLIKDHGKLWATEGNPSLMPCFQGQLGVQVRSHVDNHIRNVRIKDTSWHTFVGLRRFVQ